MGRRKSCSLLSFFLLSFSRCFIWSFFFPLHSLLFISFAFLLSLLVHVYAHIERGNFCQSALYLRRASTSNGFDVLSDATRVPVPREVRVHTHTHAHVRGAIPHACARVFSVYVHRRVHIPIPRRTIRRVGKTRKDSTHTHTHTHTHEPHGRELCLARDVKLLAIS